MAVKASKSFDKIFCVDIVFAISFSSFFIKACMVVEITLGCLCGSLDVKTVNIILWKSGNPVSNIEDEN